jgi:hypothetical protein
MNLLRKPRDNAPAGIHKRSNCSSSLSLSSSSRWEILNEIMEAQKHRLSNFGFQVTKSSPQASSAVAAAAADSSSRQLFLTTTAKDDDDSEAAERERKRTAGGEGEQGNSLCTTGLGAGYTSDFMFDLHVHRNVISSAVASTVRTGNRTCDLHANRK